jgi:hypothetical protein
MVNNKAIRVGLYNKLNVAGITSLLAKGSASLFHAVVPSSGSYPLVVFNKQAGTPTHQFGGAHFDSQLWLVKAIVKGGSSSEAEDIAKAIADQLDFGTLTITGGTLMHLERESDVDYAEVSDGEVFRHHGFLLRLIVQ